MTVVIPGMVFYGTLRVLLGLFGISSTLLVAFDKSETLTISLILACGILLQVVGIIVECIAFKYGPYRHAEAGMAERWKKMELGKKKENEKIGKQYVWDRKYDVIATMTEGNETKVEYILAQFFMSHNISIAMMIHTIWILVYVLRSGTVITSGHQLTSVMVIFLTIFSFYIPYNRFNMSSNVLFEFYLKNEDLSQRL
jgi:hypothetical protein